MVRVSRREYLRLLETCRYADKLARENAHHAAQTRAIRRLLEPDVRCAPEERDRSIAYLMTCVPLTAAGDLHVAAFEALLEREVWRLYEASVLGSAPPAPIT